MASDGQVRHTLPRYASSLIGRDDECQHVMALLRDPAVQLVTIVGPGGVGKTRLATHVAGELEPETPDDTVFVPLSIVTDADRVLPEIGNGFGVYGENLEALVGDAWARFTGIVVLDNLEQVLDIAPTLARLLSRAHGMKVLATSQSPLMIDGEHVMRLDPLAVPADDAAAPDALISCSSVQLFLQRAREHDASFRPEGDPESLADIAGICRLLDGMPLAVELAAARTVVLTPPALRAQLNRGLEVLSSSRRDMPERLRTMESAIAWTYHLLTEDEQRVFRWLCVFPGGFDLALVDRVLGRLGIDVPHFDMVGSLMDRSLCRRYVVSGEPRFYILLTLRLFGVRMLETSDEREAAQQVLAEHVIDLARRSDTALVGHNQTRWITLLDLELANIQSAVDWALEHAEPRVPMILVGGAWRFLDNQGRWRDGVEWVDRAGEWAGSLFPEEHIFGLLGKLRLLESARKIDEARADLPRLESAFATVDLPEMTARFLNLRGMLAHDENDLDGGYAWHQRAAEWSEKHGLVREGIVAHSNLGTIAYYQGRLDTAEHHWQRAADQLEAMGDRMGAATNLSNLGSVAVASEHYERAMTYLTRALAIDRELGLEAEQLYPLLNLGDTCLLMGDFESALDYLLEAADLARRVGHSFLEATAYVTLAEVHDRMGDPVTAATVAQQALDLISGEAEARQLCEIGMVVALLALHCGRHADAVAHATRAAQLGEDITYAVSDIRKDQMNALFAECRSVLGDEAIAARRESAAGLSVTAFRMAIGLTLRKIAGRRNAVLITVEPAPNLPALTRREQDVLRLLVDGYGTQAMADRLCVSPRTVTTHLTHIMAKLEISNRTELVAFALKHRLVS